MLKTSGRHNKNGILFIWENDVWVKMYQKSKLHECGFVLWFWNHVWVYLVIWLGWNSSYFLLFEVCNDTTHHIPVTYSEKKGVHFFFGALRNNDGSFNLHLSLFCDLWCFFLHLCGDYVHNTHFEKHHRDQCMWRMFGLGLGFFFYFLRVCICVYGFVGLDERGPYRFSM